MPPDPMTGALDDLNIAPPQTLLLGGGLRSRLLNFLLRWQIIEPLQACLDVLIPANPALVSLLDLRARACLAQGMHDDALVVMQGRLERKTSIAARTFLARIFLARRDDDAAHKMASALVTERSDSSATWVLLGEVAVKRGELDSALSAYRRLAELRPDSRAYLLGMLALYQARDDWVTASGYAVRLLRTAQADRPLPVSTLRRLRDYFRSSGEETRVGDIEAELGQRYLDELVELRAELAQCPGLRRSQALRQRPAMPRERERPSDGPPPRTFDEVTVSEEERQAITDSVRRLFGYEVLLPGQLETIACVMRGEDVLTILPTGGGKSLCYQLPALLAECGTVLVISPLIALMKDQLDSLPSGLRGRATAINSSLERDELRHRLDRAAEGAYRLIYAAPERLRQPSFLHAMRRAGVSRLVVDEAHCVSVWGHDFRPDYLSVGEARKALGSPPLLAMTATAPLRVRRDMLRHLGDARVIAGDVSRPNLQLEVFSAHSTDEKLRHLLAFCRAEPGSGIVYADTRRRCEDLAALLGRYGVVAGHYHAGISDRAGTQDDFMAGRIRVVVATVAFGMGIDKSDIRFIVHFSPPRSVEAYYQEAGRAGRDGLPARCLLMHAPSDRGTLTRRARSSAFTIEFLREVYGVVNRRIGGEAIGRVPAPDLGRDLGSDDTRVRVALSLLEEAGLLRRGPDLPRAVIVRLMRNIGPGDVTEFADFCRAARMRQGQALEVDLADVASRAGLQLGDIERKLLDWADAGWLSYLPSGRDLLLERVSPPPHQPAQRIHALLERQEAISEQRIDELFGYAKSIRCRHGHLSAYLGGRVIERCSACDNCTPISPPSGEGLPSQQYQLALILRCVSDSPWSWGRASLVRILVGDGSSQGRRPPLHRRASEQPSFGLLALRSEAAVMRMVGALESAGLLRARQLGHGGVVLDITPSGKRALAHPSELDSLTELSAKPAARRSRSRTDDPELEVDETLFEKLRAWRLEVARGEAMPAYRVFSNRHLRGIAAHQPGSIEALSRLKGVGPKKLEKYGCDIILLVTSHLGKALNAANLGEESSLPRS